MKNITSKKFWLQILLMLYLLVIIYFMFLGFGRLERFDSYQFSFRVYSIPLWIPKHFSIDIIKIWIFSLGNLVAFIPFGILIPINLPNSLQKYWKTLIIFVIGITIIELLQMVSLLGSFDMEDILVNMLGFSVGFVSWKIGKRGQNIGTQIILGCVSVFVFTLLCILGAEIFNGFILKR